MPKAAHRASSQKECADRQKEGLDYRSTDTRFLRPNRGNPGQPSARLVCVGSIP